MATASAITTASAAATATRRFGPNSLGCLFPETRTVPGRNRGLIRQVERSILPQDRALQPLQRRARLEAELLDQRPARRLVGLQRFGLAPAAVQRDHQLSVQALAQRVHRGQRRQLADHVGVKAQRQV